MQKKIKQTPIAIVSVVFFIMLLLICQNVFAQSESGGTVLSTEKMMTLTGQIDRIGTDSITINDTSFKISDKVSLNGFKKGQIVKFVVTENRLVLKVIHAKLKRKARQ